MHRLAAVLCQLGFSSRRSYQLTKVAAQAVLDSNMAAATSVVMLDRGNNTTCTINLHGKKFILATYLLIVVISISEK